MRIAENVKKFRLKQGLSQKQLVQSVEINQSMIAHIESGLKIPSLAIGLELAHVLNTTLDRLCED